MSKQNQIEFHRRKHKEALFLVELEKARLIRKKGEAVIGPENPVFARLVMKEIDAEQRLLNSLK
ncbi:hypothetical protein QGX23_gp121 [Pseudomonas phage PN09]|uniref:Uncharacterized protein n=1 Tax=Pseudomonas phage PN09 TaxID=2782564 RepID=A0A7S8BBK8_9CAUD|nr:hypothetical protein QGX23_gp121 [Pseudomonas phage PN09]QPB10531.1 hypothetical protein PN09_110 [Pseudomonas phage PN09]